MGTERPCSPRDGLGALVPGTDVRQSGAPEGPLAGLTFAAKDIFDIAGHVTGCGNPDWARSHDPAPGTAPAVRALLDAGADLVGKTITDELAYSINGQNFHYGTPTNVNAPGRIPGGSSSGSAAAVAGGLVDLALGSDTGGSVRVPASYCGLYGLRPSHGRLPLDGIMPLAPSFDTVGWFTREASLLRRVGDVLLGSTDDGGPGFTRLLVAEDAFAISEEATRGALRPWIERLEARIGKAEAVTIGEPGGGLEAWMWRFRIIQAREISDVHGAWIDTVQPKFGPDIAERFAWARTITRQQADDATAQRAEFSERLTALLDDGAVLALPTAPNIAPPTAGTAADFAEHRSRALSLTSIAGLAGLPQVILPLARLDGCPLGLSLIAARGRDAALLAFAESYAG